MSNLKNEVVIISKDKDNASAFSKLTKETGYNSQTINSIQDFIVTPQKNDYFAIVVDYASLLNASDNEKIFLRNTEESIPVLKARRNPQRGTISGFIEEEGYEGSALFNHFLKIYSQSFERKIIRRESRIPKALHIKISKDPSDSSNKTILASTLNVSPSGMYIISFDEWVQGENVYINIPEIHKPEMFFRAIVKWVNKPSPHQDKVPGIGVDIRHRDLEYIKLYFNIKNDQD